MSRASKCSESYRYLRLRVLSFVPRNDTSDQVLLGKIRVKIQAETQVCEKEDAAEQGSAEQDVAKIRHSKKKVSKNTYDKNSHNQSNDNIGFSTGAD